jgi:hypothetical protein
MKICIIFTVLLGSASAVADDTGTHALLALSKGIGGPVSWDGTIDELAAGAIVLDRDGASVPTGHLGARWYGKDLGKTFKLATLLDADHLTLVVDAKNRVGWFNSPIDVDTIDQQTMEREGITMRVSGIVVKEKAKLWKIAAVMITEPWSDKRLIERQRLLRHALGSGPPALSGDQTLAAEFAAWFPQELAANASTSTKRVASGTAPNEAASGAKTAKLLATWSKLALVVRSVDARVFGNGTTAFIRAELDWPQKKTPTLAVPLVLGAIVVKEGEAWRWVSLQFAPAQFPSKSGSL